MKSAPVVVICFVLTTFSGIMAAVMGLAGPSTNILFVAWFFVPAPVLLGFLLIGRVSNFLRKASLLYISMSVLSTGLFAFNGRVDRFGKCSAPETL